MNSRIKKLILGSTVVIAVLAFFVFRAKKSVEAPMPISPSTIPIELYPTISMRSVSSTTQSTVFTIEVTPGPLPKSLQQYKTTPHDPLEVGRAFAAKLLVNTKPEQNGDVYYWRTNELTITSQNNPPGVSYTSRVPILQSVLPSDAEADRVAKSFLRDATVTLSGFDAKITGITRFASSDPHPEPSSSKTKDAVRIGYDLLLSGLEVVDNTGGTLHASVTLGGGGVMKAASFSIVPDLTPLQDAVVLPVEQAIIALTNNKGLLTSVMYETGNVGGSLTRPTIKSATITSISLIYFWDRTTQTIKPIYEFKGFSLDDGLGRKILLIYYVSATQ